MTMDHVSSADLLKEEVPKNALRDLSDGAWAALDKARLNPFGTATDVAVGLSVGGAIQVGLNRAELADGAVGSVARTAKKWLQPVTLAIMGVQVLRADNPVKEIGQQVFDATLFLGTAKLGGSLVSHVPVLKNSLGPKLTETSMALEKNAALPRNLQFELVGNDRVRILRSPLNEEKTLVRLSNEKGFFVNSRDFQDTTLPLRDLPSRLSVEGLGAARLQYGEHSATMQVGDTLYTYNNFSGRVKATRGDEVYGRTSRGDVEIYKNDQTTTLYKGSGGAEVTIGNMQSGQAWSFHGDGSIQMRSLPYGRERFNIASDGVGTHVSYHGTSRGIAGLPGRRTNGAPLRATEQPVKLTADRSEIAFGDGSKWALPRPDTLPAGTDVKKFMDDFSKAETKLRDIFDKSWERGRYER